MQSRPMDSDVLARILARVFDRFDEAWLIVCGYGYKVVLSAGPDPGLAGNPQQPGKPKVPPHSPVCVCMHAGTHGWMDGWMDGWIDG